LTCRFSLKVVYKFDVNIMSTNKNIRECIQHCDGLAHWLTADISISKRIKLKSHLLKQQFSLDKMFFSLVSTIINLTLTVDLEFSSFHNYIIDKYTLYMYTQYNTISYMFVVKNCLLIPLQEGKSFFQITVITMLYF